MELILEAICNENIWTFTFFFGGVPQSPSVLEVYLAGSHCLYQNFIKLRTYM